MSYEEKHDKKKKRQHKISMKGGTLMRHNLKASIIVLTTIIASVFGMGFLMQTNAEEDNTPKHYKVLENNGDGTFALSLNVTGAIEPKQATANANILVIYDVSGSMTNDDSYIYTEFATGRYGKVGSDYVQLYTRSGNSYTALNNDTNSTATSLYYRTGYYSYTYHDYTGEKRYRHVTRGAATEQIVYNFANDLLSYNKTETATNVEMALLTFSTNSTNDNIVQTWTSKKDTFLGKLSNTGNTTKLNYGGGTNWEAAMRKALDVLAQADKDPTYVVFVTDGGPTLRVGGGQGNKVEKENYSAAIDEARNIQNYNTADHTYTNAANSNTEMYGIYAFGTEADYLDDLIYYAHNGSERTVSTDTEETPYYYNASDEKELADAITEILTSIITAIGVTDVSINDGTTSNVQLSSGEIVDLLTIDESSFTYWMSKEVKKDSNGRIYTDRIDRNNGETFKVYVTDLGNNQVRCTWTRPSDNVAHDITVTGYIKDDVLSIQWKTAEEGGHSPELFFNQDPPAAYVENGTVKWDISSVGTLLNGVTYTVKFDVWKTQLVFDLIADLENNVVSYTDLAQGSGTKYAGLDKYIIQECTGNSCSYRLITNTTAKLFYKDTRFGDELQEQPYDTPRGIDVASDTISIHKNWRNYYDDKEIADSITVELLQDGKPYIERTLSKQNGWRNVRTTYISPGLMKIKYTTDPETGKQIASGVEILDHGHDYAFAEPDDSAYNWQLVSETVHPMVLNGTLTELIKIDSNITNAFSLHDQPLEDYYIPLEMVNDPNLMYMTSNRGNHFVRLTAGGDVYLIADDVNPTIEAYNYRRSNLNIKKIIDGTSAPDNTLFTFDINVNDTGLNENEKLYFSVYDNGFIDLGANLLSTGWTKEIKDGNWTGYYYAENNTPLSVKLTKTQNLRFNNLTTKATFTVTEKDIPNKFTYTDTKVTAWYGNTNGEYLKDNDLKYNINKANKTVTGSITMTNTTFYVDTINTYQSTDIKVNKIWDDNNNQDGLRPSEVIVTLYADGNPIINTAGEPVTGTITGTGNNWNYTFTDLPRFNNEGKEITYTVQETAIEGYKTTYSEDKLTITNTHTPEPIDVTITKIWEDKNNQDNLRPNNVKVTLYANGEPVLDEEEKPVTATITGTGNNWTYTFKNLNKKANGKDIIYTVKEDTVANYTTSYSEDGLTITNTHEVAQFEYSVEKTWRDDNNRDGIRPSEITVNLLDEDEKIVKTIKLTAANNWTGKFENVDKYKNGEVIAYTIKEVVPEGYTASYAYNSTNTKATINNIHDPEETSVTINKTWKDNNNQDGLRPSKINVRLYANGTEIDNEIVTPDENDEWTYTFEHLNKKENGKAITYTISEDTITGYTTSINDTTITNTLTNPEKTQLTVTKTWVDNNNQDNLRKEVTVKLLKDGEETDNTLTLNEGNNWTGTFTNLDKNKDGGTPIVYTVEEVSVEGYTTIINYNKDTATITNTLTNPEKTTFTVEKVWNDMNNQDGLRKDILVNLYANNKDTGKSITLNEENHYTYTFTNLDKNANGKKITYTVKEISIEGYTTSYDYDTENKGIITNTHTPETTSLEVTKTWADNNNQDGIRPDRIIVTLVKNGTPTTRTITLNEGNSWKNTFTNLDKYENGNLITYTTQETAPEGYTASYSCTNNTCTVTNTHTSETTEYTVEKVWNDINNQDGLRPTSILFKLLANGVETNYSVTLNEDNNWKHTFINLPKKDNGNIITYSIKEADVTGYTSTITPGENKATVTNTHTPETTKVTITKTWIDNNNQDNLRPDSITVNLLADGNTKETVELNNQNNWTYTFNNLPKNNNGKLITYTVQELEVEGYTTKINGYNITNTLTNPEKVTIEGEKVWKDNNNQDGIRPERITVNLYADGTKVDSQVVTSSNNWKYSFINLDKNKAGKEITYTINEEKVEGYTTTIEGTTITNTLTNPEKTKLEVEKVWKDNNNQDGIRPTSIEVTLYANGENTGKTLTLNEDNSWKSTFSNLDKNENGKKITYTVKELEVEGYTTEATYENTKATITNTLTNPEKVTIEGEKVWKDNNNQDGIRPEKVTINLYADGTKIDSKIVKESDNWKYSFTDLDKNKAGKEITYTVNEEKVEGYTTTIEGTTITNTLTNPQKTQLEVEKVWKDNNNQDGIRSKEITVILVKNGTETTNTITLNEENNWSGTFSNLDKNENGEEISYTVKEISVEGYTTSTSYNKTKATITNTLTDPAKTSVEGEKVWNDNNNQDGIRPEKVTINLYADGTKIDSKIVNASNNWKYSFTDLDKNKNGKEITYTVNEEKVEGYTTTIEGTTITNTLTNPEKTKLDVEKVWNDKNNQDGIRPASIEVTLYKNGTITEQKLILNEENNWSGSFSDLVRNENGKAIKYTVEENELADYERTITYDNNKATIVNKHNVEKTSVEGTKTWNDADNQDGIRPEKITVNLYANGTKVDSQTVSENNGTWTYTFSDLPKYENGEEITYTIKETAIEGYESEVNGYNITNTHEIATTSVKGTKTWKDNNNQDGIRPNSITVRLYANSKEVSSTIVTAENDWTYEFKNLPKYDNGKKITYTITEDEVEGYTTKLDDYDITNTHKLEVTTVSGTKTWQDNNDQDGVRPERIIINLLANGEKVDNKVVREKNGTWTYTFTDLPKYENGKLITYTVEEVPVDGYVATVEGTDITNTHEIGTTSVTGTKTWQDTNNQDGLRPESITVRLYADGKEVDSTTTSEKTDWTYTFSNLPKYNDGKKITYTISEDEVEGYTTKITDYDITNTHKPETTEVSGTKTWQDSDNQDGIRPETITVRLYANGERIDSKVVREKNGTWTYTFTDLPKYENGKEISYIIDEITPEGYTTKVDGYNITNTHETGITSITGTKTWKDNNNQDGLRPESITIRLYADGKEIDSTTTSQEKDWNYSFDNLPKYKNGKKITYTITEDTIPEYTTKIEDYDIINTHKPGTTNISGTKTWQDNNNQDGIRPERITVNLYADGVKVDSKVVKEKNGTWTYTFTDLPKYENGKEISYTIDEITPEGYTSKVEGYDITNTLTNPEKTQLEVEKVWNDNNNQDGIRPETITVTLYKNGEVTDKQLVLSKDNNWTGQFIELDKNIKGTPITYTIKENEIEGYTEKTTCKKTTCTIENTLTNPEKITINGEKIWNDNNNQDGIRPEKITINLYADGKKVDTTTTTEKKEWKYQFTNLDKNKEGKAIVYTVEEVSVEGYTTKIDDFNITNTHETDLTSITITKTWKDSDNQDGVRPESITVRLYANGEEIASQEITAASDWTYTFSNLQKYQNGKKINYTITEDKVENYTTKIEDYNIINTHKTETIDINGTKTWKDDNNRDGLRPDRITINLLANGVKVDTTTAKSTNWEYKFTNLPKYKDGKVITYTIEEVPVDGYTTKIDGYNITNTHELGTTSVTGKKTWKDASNQDGMRPEKVTINLLADGVKVDTTEITEATDWKYTFSNLPKYENGKKITYTIEELAIEGYTTIIDGFNITNTHKPELTEVSGTKTWEDDNNRDDIRPNRITVYLYDGETKIDTTTTTEQDNWTYTFTDLPKYRNGELISYTVSEKEVKGYTSTTDGYNITNTHTIETKDITGTKTWIDDNNRDGLRPASITVHLLADGEEVAKQTVTADTDWTYKFEKMPVNNNGKVITYSITEDEVSGYTGEVNESNITNTHKIITKDIEITKVWVDNNNQDNLRPGSITVNLLANNNIVKTEKVEVENISDNTWKYTFKDVPMYENGKEITYTIEEEQVKDYTTKVEGFTIINTHNPNKIHIKGEKTWDDETNIYGRPESIKVTLKRSVGEKTFEPITKEVTEKDNWKYDFGEFPEYDEGKLITYTIEEEAVKDYTTVIDGYNIKNTYTPETFSIKGEKTWDDVDNQDGIRPDTITIELYANDELVKTTTASEESEWKYSFDNIVKYANGKEITYTIKEKDVEGYTSELTNYDITNTHTPETITYNIKKIWEDYNNNDNLRPDFIKVTLYKMIEDKKAIVNVVNMTEDNDWTYTFKDLPRYDKGTEIEYIIVEDTVYGYETNIDNVKINDENTTQVVINSTITNTHEKELTDISGTKTWDDDDNYDGLRPESININLYADGELQETRTISEQDNWTYTFKDLLKYHEGKPINYTVDEDEVFGYIKTIQNYNIINKHIHETTSISGKKIWVDEDDKDGLRPDSVTIKLYANGEHIDTIILTKSNNWMYIFNNLDKYKDGKEIKYTIEEEAVPDYITIYDGYNIMNIHNPGKGSDVPPKPEKKVEVMPPKTGITGTSHPGNIIMLITAIISLLGIRIKVKE